MIKIRIITIGKLKEKYLIDGCNEYLKRLTSYCKVEIVELDEEKSQTNPSNAQIELVKSKEGERIINKINERDLVVILDVEGDLKTSEEVAFILDKAAINGQSTIDFIIGGSFGLANEVKNKGQIRLSLSKMTFTHQMTRLILLEQIYRAFKINNNETYHK